jgi:hypothetical protein
LRHEAGKDFSLFALQPYFLSTSSKPDLESGVNGLSLSELVEKFDETFNPWTMETMMKEGHIS